MTRPPKAKPGLTVWWWCLDCAETGQGDNAAQRHTRDTDHATVTTLRAHPSPAQDHP